MFCTACSVSAPWGMLLSKVCQVISIKCKVITTFRAPPLLHWSISIFQHNPQDQWFIYIILAQCKFSLAEETRPLLSHPFTNRHFHFLIIVKSVTSQMQHQRPKLHEAICWKIWTSLAGHNPSARQCATQHISVTAAISAESSGPPILVWPCPAYHLFRLLNQHLGNWQFHNEGVEMAVHEWTWVQEPQFYPNGICKHMLRWDTGINVHSDYVLKWYFRGIRELHWMMQGFHISFYDLGQLTEHPSQSMM